MYKAVICMTITGQRVKNGMEKNWSSYLFIYLLIKYCLFLAALGLHCCARAFSSYGERGLLFVVVCGLLIAVASLTAACGLSSCGSWALEHSLSSCGAWASLLHGMWHLPRPGIEPVSPVLAGGFLTTAPPGKYLEQFLYTIVIKLVLI